MESVFQMGREVPSNIKITSVIRVAMDLALALARYGHALGRWQAGWRFAAPELRHAVSLALLSAAWDTFRRDAGPGDVGPAHDEPAGRAGVTSTDDPRRDGILLWLADHGTPPVAEAAALLVRMVGATRRFGEEEQSLLEAARDALAAGVGRQGRIARALPIGENDDNALLALLHGLAGAIDRLRSASAFAEAVGSESHLAMNGEILRRHVAPEPAGAWALDLALLAVGSPFAGGMPVPGLVSRALFRPELEPEEIVANLVDGVATALELGCGLLHQLGPELARGQAALAHLSRHARARDAWRLVAALRSVTRIQLGRALALSRAGADIQAHTLAEAGLVSLRPGGRVDWRLQRSAECGLVRLDVAPLSEAISELDTTMAEIDRLLARTAR